MMTTYRSQSLQDRHGMNWGKFWQAYCLFMPNPAQAILHILAAGRSSQWQRWVLRRLSRQREKSCWNS